MKKFAKKIVMRRFSAKIEKKTKLSKVQSDELAETLIRILYGLNGLRFWRNRMYLRTVYGIDWKRFSFTEETFQSLIGKPKYNPEYREPMGIWYTIDSEADYRDAPQVQNSDRITYYASGREPLLAVANHVAPERKVVLLPFYTCGTVFQPFLENGWEVVCYKVTRDLRIDIQNVLELYNIHKPSIAVFMEYGGKDLTREELDAVGKLKQAGCVTIVDRAQNLYSEKRDPEVDFYCGSLRKWYRFPDGGYLERNGEISMPPLPKEGIYNDVYATTCGAMMFLNSLARRTKVDQYRQLAEFFRKLSTSYVCCEPVRERNMSAYSKAVYLIERQNDEVYKQRRMENYRYIHSRIASFTLLRPICSDLARVTSTPFYYDIYARDRNHLSRYLSEKGIATWIQWAKPGCLGELDGDTAFIFRHCLSLPCDQRYTLEDMEKLCDALEAYEKLWAK